MGIGRDGYSVTPWQGDPATAYLRVRDPNTPLDTRGLSQILDHLGSAGYESVVTPALHAEEAQAYFATGFSEFDSLIVLGHTLDRIPDPIIPSLGSIVLDRARRRDLQRIFDLDSRAFPPRWRLDHNGLDEARRATTRVHFRVARDPTIAERRSEQVVGYAISGRTGTTAFLQRLAVDPDHAGRGTGSTMVIDCLRWAARHRCSNLLVNTQTTNLRALLLYERLGFTRSSTRLVVLRYSL